MCRYNDLKESRERAAAHVKWCEEQANRAKATKLYMEAITGLATDWRDRDPGKYHPVWFFVKEFDATICPNRGTNTVTKCDGFWIASFADDPTQVVIGRPIEKSFWSSQAPPPTPVPLGKWKEVAEVDCPKCKHKAIVVGCYEQTDDSAEGDTWELSIHSLCQECLTMSELARSWSDYRFCSFGKDGHLLG